MYVRQYLVVTKGDARNGSTPTASVTHHRMFWAGLPSLEDTEQCAKESVEHHKWVRGITIGVYPLKGYWLWNSDTGITPAGVTVSFADRCRNTRASLAHSVARTIRKFKLLKYTIYTSKK